MTLDNHEINAAECAYFSEVVEGIEGHLELDFDTPNWGKPGKRWKVKPSKRLAIIERDGYFVRGGSLVGVGTVDIINARDELVTKGHSVDIMYAAVVSEMRLVTCHSYTFDWYAKKGKWVNVFQASSIFASAPDSEPVNLPMDVRGNDAILPEADEAACGGLENRLTRSRMWRVLPLLQGLEARHVVQLGSGASGKTVMRVHPALAPQVAGLGGR